LDDIPFTDMYLFTGNDDGTNCYDIAVCILKKPVEFEGKIVPGIELDKLKAFTETERVSAVSPRHHIRLEGPSGEALPVDQRPVVIGYGVTGLKDGQIPYRLSSSFSAEQMRSLWGLDIKKAITVNGLDLNGQGHLQNMLGCRCADFPWQMAELSLLQLEEKLRTQSCEANINQAADRLKKAADYLRRAKDDILRKNGRTMGPAKACFEKARQFSKEARQFSEKAKAEMETGKREIEHIIAKGKEYFEQFSETKSSYALPLAGGGFSGSLVVSKRDDGNYNAIGICSGPLFTGEIKSFIENATRYHHELSLRRR
jgi:hypothetical protein